MGLLPHTSPIIVAPMAGGVSTPTLVLAAAQAGALGFLPGGYVTAEALDNSLSEVEARTDRPYGVNLFVPAPPLKDTRGTLAAYATALAPTAAGAGVALGTPIWDGDALEARLQAQSRHRPAVVSFTFGLPDPETVESLQDRGVLVAYSISTVEEAAAAYQRGVDAVIAQGSEAGGHGALVRDNPDDPAGGPLIGRRALLRQIRADLPIAVVTAGGIRTGAEIADAEQLGAVAAQLGTAFLCCRETGTTTARRAGTGWAAATEEPAAAIIARLERERRTALAGAD